MDERNPKESERLRDLERTRNELLIAERDYTEQLTKAKNLLVRAVLVVMIQMTHWGIARLDSTPPEQLGGITLKIMNKHTGKEYRNLVTRITKMVSNDNKDDIEA